MTRIIRGAVVALLLGGMFTSFGCGDSGSPVIPGTPVVPPGILPTVTSISPSAGSTGGGASVKITGTGLNRGSFAIFDGVSVAARFDSRDVLFTTMYVETPPHGAGPVDVVVTSLDGGTVRVGAGYSYLAPESFDLNGVWTASGMDGSDRGLGFTIEKNRLVSAYCSGVDGLLFPLWFTSPPLIVNGEFVIEGPDAPVIFGRVVSAVEMVGTIDVAPCNRMPWRSYPKTQ